MKMINKNFKKVLWFLFPMFLLIAVFGLWRSMPFWLPCYFAEINTGQPIQFGDRFEAVNALFAGLAFAGVIFTILLQWRELKATQEELKGQKIQLQAQDQTLQKQNFEISFFQLLGFHGEIVNSMVIYQEKEYSGRMCFDFMLKKLKAEYDDNDAQKRAIKDSYGPLSPDKIEKTINQISPEMKKELNQIYEKFFAKYQSYVGHYFRHLYNAVTFVDEHDFFDNFCDNEALKKKRFYINLIRAQLSSNELGLLFYNCLSERGSKFKPLVETYSLLKDMDFKTIITEHKKLHRLLYTEDAYGKSSQK